MIGLYRLKPTYARLLRPFVDTLESRGISPDAVSAAGVACGSAAGLVVAFAEPGPMAALLVAALVAGRLGCANMDGTLARRRAPRAFGAVVNELGDRIADLALLAGLCTHLGWATGAVMLAATLPSWASLAVASNGRPRSNSGPMGKTERCALLVIATATGWFAPIAVVVVIGSVITAAVRLVEGARTAQVSR